MPHVTLECSQNIASSLQSANACQCAFEMLVQANLFSTADIKVRLYPTPDFYVGNKGKDGSFVHALIQILEGRELSQKQALTQAMFTMLNQLVPQADSVTVDIKELNRDTYQKRRLQNTSGR